MSESIAMKEADLSVDYCQFVDEHGTLVHVNPLQVACIFAVEDQQSRILFTGGASVTVKCSAAEAESGLIAQD